MLVQKQVETESYSMASAEFDENSDEKTNCSSWRPFHRKTT